MEQRSFFPTRDKDEENDQEESQQQQQPQLLEIVPELRDLELRKYQQARQDLEKYDEELNRLIRRRVRHVRRLNVEAIDYSFAFKPPPEGISEDLVKALDYTQDNVDSLVRQVKSTMDDKDLVCLFIDNRDLANPLWVSFRPAEHLNANSIMSEIGKVAQSNREFVLNGNFDIRVTRIETPQGGGHRLKFGLSCPIEETILLKTKAIHCIPHDNCLPRSIVVAKAIIDRHPNTNNIKRTPNTQLQHVKELLVQVPSIKLNQYCSLQDVQAFQDALKDYQIFVFSTKNQLTKPIWPERAAAVGEQKKIITLLYHDNHFSVIKKICGALDCSYYCFKCFTKVANRLHHKCLRGCRLCGKDDCPGGNESFHCKNCRRTFLGQQCYTNHLKVINNKRKMSVCDYVYKCGQCGVLIDRRTRKAHTPHRCSEIYCRVCRSYQTNDHKCFVMPYREARTNFILGREENYKDDKYKAKQQNQEEDANPKERERKVFVFFDIESTQNTCTDMERNEYLHVPNLVCATVCCELCQDANDDTFICDCGPAYIQFGFESPDQPGPSKKQRPSWKEKQQEDNIGVSEKPKTIKYGKRQDRKREMTSCKVEKEKNTENNPLMQFCRWLFQKLPRTGRIITVMTHYFKGYDGQFVLQYCFENCCRPTAALLTGSKINYLQIGKNIRFVDSFNFLPMALSALPTSYGFDSLKKGYFPHFFNEPKNYNYIGPIPAVEFYNPDGMKLEEQERFLEWHRGQQKQLVEFDFRREIVAYCRSDVEILKRASLAFRRIFMDSSGIDPLIESMTIAGACLLLYRKMFLSENTIAKIPPNGYAGRDRQSAKAIAWLKWLSKSRSGIQIRHSLNGREEVICNRKVDGWCPEINTVFEFHGCVWHGCPTCFPNRNQLLPSSDIMTMELAYEETIKRDDAIRQAGYKLETKWECEFEREMQNDVMMSAYCKSPAVRSVVPLNPREAFFGGRTNASRLYYEAGPNERIDYYDVVSLYPFICKYGKFVLGHPRLLTENLATDVFKYEGLIKCRVLPPNNLYFPVLPARINNKLVFTLCRSCAETKNNGPCTHIEIEDRSLLGEWVSCELQAAVERGYKILELYEVWQFDETSQYDRQTGKKGLFSDYINMFVKGKVEATGWPIWTQADDDKEKKQQFVEQYRQIEGIELDPAAIEKNPGRRGQCKLMLNSFWGKFGQRHNLPKTEYLDEPGSFFNLLYNPAKEINSLEIVSDEMVQVQYRTRDEYNLPNSVGNVVVAAYVTAQARLHLYKYLEMLGERVLYYDTDSIIFTSNPGQEMPPKGEFLGQFNDELATYGPGARISRFASGGPKNYAFQVVSKDGTQLLHTTCKVKGIPLNVKNSAVVNMETMIRLLKDRENTVQIEEMKIARTAGHQVVTRKTKKTYRVVYDKRRLLKEFFTVPFGYRLTMEQQHQSEKCKCKPEDNEG